MPEETLFNDSEVFTTERPKVITDKQQEEFLHEIAAEIIKDGYSKSNKSNIIEDLRRINFLDSGYDIAKEIEHGNARYSIDSNFVEFLEGLNYKRGNLLENNIKSWVSANKIQPKLKVGDELIINKDLNFLNKSGMTVYVTGALADRGAYLIDADRNRKGGNVIEYERVEECCSIVKNEKK